MEKFQKFQKHGLAVFAVVLALGYGSYSYAKARLATNWHLIASQGATPAEDEIGSITMDPTQSGDCDSPTTSDRCAIQLKNDNNFNLVGQEVEDAVALPGVSEEARTYYE